MLLRARLFRYTSQVACVLVAGIGALALLVLGLSLNPPADLLSDLLVRATAAAWTSVRSGSPPPSPPAPRCSPRSA